LQDYFDSHYCFQRISFKAGLDFFGFALHTDHEVSTHFTKGYYQSPHSFFFAYSQDNT